MNKPEIVVVTGASAGLRRAIVVPSCRSVPAGISWHSSPSCILWRQACHSRIYGLAALRVAHDQSHVQVTSVLMPALNTPQFRWGKSRLPGKAQPVPPIFQPEVGAATVVWAARHSRRELYVGWPTVKAIVGNKIVPWLGDWYLARTGYQAQQMSEPTDADRPHNLWEAVPGDHGAHGVFDARAHEWSAQVWETTHRGWLTFAGLGLAGLAYREMKKSRHSR